MGISVSLRSVDQQGRQLAVRFYSRWYYVRSGVVVSARRIRSSHEQIYTKQTKIFGQKNYHLSFFVNVPRKLFNGQKINLEDILIHNWANGK